MFTFRNRLVLAWLALTLAVAAAAQTAGSPAQRIAVTVDAAKTAAPISPYLYGQFIEHIADTINRSLWAEMLDDRKFFHDVNSKPVPERAGRGGQGPGRGRGANLWRPMGPDESVTMDREHVYTGQHSPLIKLDGAAPRGILQAGIVLRNDRTYSGRVVLASDPGVNVTVNLVWGSGPNDRQIIPIQGRNYSHSPVPALSVIFSTPRQARGLIDLGLPRAHNSCQVLDIVLLFE